MRVMAGLVVAVLIIFTMNLFWPSNKADDGHSAADKESAVVAITERNDVSVDLNAPSDDAEVTLMMAEYAILEQGRHNLKRRLARLRHEIWGLKFPTEKAKHINETLLNAHKLLKNPYMLGAFSDVEEIQTEIEKVRFADKSLDQIHTMIETHDSGNKVSG